MRPLDGDAQPSQDRGEEGEERAGVVEAASSSALLGLSNCEVRLQGLEDSQ